MKKYILFVMLMFSIGIMQVGAANNLMQCDYSVPIIDKSIYIKYRILYLDDGSIVQSMPQNGDENYTEALNGKNFYPTTFKVSDDTVFNSLPLSQSSFTSDVMKSYYEKSQKSCPYFVFNNINYSFFPAEDSSLNNGVDYVAVEGVATLFNENEEPEAPVVPQLNDSCKIHTDDGDIPNIPGFTIEFQMYDNGEKYLKVYFNLRGEKSAQTVKVGKEDVVVRPVDSYNKTYTITLPADEIPNVFKQNFQQINNNQFTCIDSSQIYFIEESGIQDARYRISTNKDEADKYDHTTNFQEGDGALDVNLDGLIFSNSNCQSYLGVVTDKNDPAYYLDFAFKLIKYAAIVILFVFTLIDFFKAVVANKHDDLKKAVQAVIKRFIIAVIIFFLPVLIEFLLDVLGIISTDPTCGIK